MKKLNNIEIDLYIVPKIVKTKRSYARDTEVNIKRLAKSDGSVSEKEEIE